MSKFLKVIVNIFLIGAILAAVAILLPPVLGVSTTIVESSSMSTNLKFGSVTYSTTVDVSEIKAGDEVLKENGSSVYAYIVRTADPVNGQFVCVSATDPNAQEETVMLRNTVSKVAVSVPYLGYLVIAMNSLEGRLIIGLVVALIVILFVLSELWKEEPEDEEIDEDEDTGHTESAEEGGSGEDRYPAELTAREDTGIDTDAIREAVEENRAAEEAGAGELTGEGAFGEETSEDAALQEQVPEEGTENLQETPEEETAAAALAEESGAAEEKDAESASDETNRKDRKPKEKLTWAERRAARKAKKKAEKEAAKRQKEETPETVSAFEIPHPEKETDTATTPEEAAQALDEASRTSGIYEPDVKVNTVESAGRNGEAAEELPEDIRDMLQEAAESAVEEKESAGDNSEGDRSEVKGTEYGPSEEAAADTAGESAESSLKSGNVPETEKVSVQEPEEVHSKESKSVQKAAEEAITEESSDSEAEFSYTGTESPDSTDESSGLTDVTEEPVVLDDGRFVPVERPTLEEIRRQAKSAGIAPKETRDNTTGITVVDYSGLL